MRFVNIVTSDRGWILEKLASELTSRLPYVRHGDSADLRADLQYYVTYSTWKGRVSPLEVAYFAHLERDEQTAKKFFSVAAEVDFCVCHSRLYEDVIRDHGIARVVSISPGVDLQAFQPIVKIGVVGRTYHTGRKGEALVQQVMDVSGIEWHFTGEGWPAPGRHIPEAQLSAFYNEMDYILVPALYEGGPMCVVEALACGVPVISSKVGWVPEFPHIEFKNGDAVDLRRVLEAVVAERRKLRASVEDRTWERWAEDHDRLFHRLFAERGIDERTISISGPQSSVGKVVLLTHGSERSSLGGPTIRVPATVRHLRSIGCQADALHFPDLDMRQADLIHGFNVWSPQTSSAMARQAKRLGKPYVFSPIFLDHSEHAFWSRIVPALYDGTRPLEIMESEIGAARQTFERNRAAGLVSEEAAAGHHATVRETIALADHVILLSECERQSLERIGAKPAAQSIVRNPVDAKRFGEADPRVFAEAYGLRDYILCVARVEPRKNQLLMLQALHGLNLPIVLIGAVSNKAYGEAIERFANANLHMLGRINSDSPLIPSALAGARVVVLPSWSEGAPLAALEAGASGASMVLSNRSSEFEYFGGFARYCDPAAPRSIREQILAAYDSPLDPSRRAELKAHVETKYSWSRYAEATLSVYEQALAAHRVARSRHRADQRVSVIGDDTSKAASAPVAYAVVARQRRHVVLDVTTTANHKGRWTGIARFEMAMARALLKQEETEVSFVAWHDPSKRFAHIYPNAIESGDVAGNLAISGQKRISPRLPPSGAPLIVGGSAWMQNTRYVEAVSDFSFAAGLHLSSVFHDIIPVKFPHWFGDGYAPRFVGNLKTLLSASRRIISVSENTKTDIETFAFENGLFLPPVGLLREGDDFDVGGGEKHGEPSTDIVGELTNREFVLAVGAIHARKNYSLLSSIWGRLAGQLKGKCPCLVIVGGVAWNGGDVHRSLVEAPGLVGKVRVIHNADDPSLLWLYKNCLFTVYPSLYEGWGLPVGESLSHGKICIASNTSSVPEIAPELTDLIDPLDFAAWLTRIKYYLSSKSAREAREKEIKADYRPHSWRDTAIALGELLASASKEQHDLAGYLPGTIAKVASPPSDGIELKGWHSRERWGTWSAQETGTIRIPLRAAIEGCARLAIIARAVASENDRASCTVSLNGGQIGTIHFMESELRLFSFDIPAACIEQRREVVIAFTMSRLSNLGETDNKDSRPVGIGLSELAIVPVVDKFVPTHYTNSLADVQSIVHPGHTIDLRDAAAAAALLRAKPAVDTAWGARLPGTYPALKIMLHETIDDDLDVTLRYRAVATLEERFSAAVIADFNHMVGELRSTTDDIVVQTIRIPKTVHMNVQPLVLEVATPTNRSPEQLGLGHDGASFGMGFLSIEVAPAQRAEWSAVRGDSAYEACEYEVNDTISLGLATAGLPRSSAERFLDIQTWHNPEENGRWSMGREGRLVLRISQRPAGPIGISLDVNVPGELAQLRPDGVSITLSVNGYEIVREAFQSGAVKRLAAAIPSNLLRDADVLNVSIASDADCVPYQISKSAKDDRRIGVFVSEFVVAELSHEVLADKVPKQYRPGQSIHFGTSDTGGNSISADGCIDGNSWHGAEPEGRWTRGRSGRLELDLREPPSADLAIRVVASVGAGVSRELGPRQLTLRLNGIDIATMLVTNGRDVALSGVIPKEGMNGEGRLRVEISIDQCFRPSEHGSDDDRELGVFVKGVIIDAVGNLPASLLPSWLSWPR